MKTLEQMDRMMHSDLAAYAQRLQWELRAMQQSIAGGSATMKPDRPPTITELIARLGEPQNFAEQGLLYDLRRLEARHAQIVALLTADPTIQPLTPFRRELLDREADSLWSEVLTIVVTIERFRQWGHKPLMADYDEITERLERESTARISKRET